MTVITPLNDIRPAGNRFGFFPFGKKWVLQYPHDKRMNGTIRHIAWSYCM
jgi:hypothetical protein